ncbi:tapasin-related protein [Ambystoma mexicanum]|uniref:tapasin-related protein n=1 Tax=Ambystoma mexicanum TaxID=8296 RepID=UPI0037E7DF6D
MGPRRWVVVGSTRPASHRLLPAFLAFCLAARQGLCEDLHLFSSDKKQREVDLVLDCIYLQEKTGHFGAFTSGLSHDSATLVLRNIRVTDGEYLDAYTDFEPQVTDENAIIFEGTGQAMEASEAETVLHADCNGQEVICEISPYFARSKTDKMAHGREGAGLDKEVETIRQNVVLDQERSESDQEEAGFQEGNMVAVQEEVGLSHEGTEPGQEEAGFDQERAQHHQTDLAHASSYFIFFVHIPDGNFSTTMVMKTASNWNGGEGEPRLHPRLNVLLSDKGTIPLLVDLSVFTRTPSLIAAIGNSVTLDCGLLSPSLDTAAVEWRIQHQGNGRTIHQYSPEKGERSQSDHMLMDPQRLRELGYASLTITSIKVKDEGSYICLITTPSSHAQQIVHVNVQEPPRVSLSVLPRTHGPIHKTVVTCDISGYFPLDVQVQWSQGLHLDGLTGAVEVHESYSSSHRQNKDGTFSITSSIEVETLAVDNDGGTYTCIVSHISLREPIRASILLEPAGSVFLSKVFISSILLVTIIIPSYLILKLRNRDRANAKDTEGQKLKLS